MRKAPTTDQRHGKEGGIIDQEIQDSGNNSAGGGNARGDRNKAKDGQQEGTGALGDQGENNMNIGTGGLIDDNFTILLVLRLKRPMDDSPTKAVAEFFHALLLAEPKSQIPP